MKEYVNRNLQKTSFIKEDLSNTQFSNCDLRGTDFTGANLSSAKFINVKTGITPSNTFLIFLVALAVSALSGYIAMVAGTTVQGMLASEDKNLRISGMMTAGITLISIVFYYWKGGSSVFRLVLVPVLLVAAAIGFSAYFSGLGTGKGMLYLVMVLLLLVVMFIVGTIARTAAGTLSSILFLIVAMSGGIFGRTVGGGIGTVVMAVSCALISKRALSGAPGFENLRKFAFYITSRFGTSFRQCHLANADFSQSKTIRNADFSNADTATVHWGNSKKLNCLPTKEQ